MIDSLVARNQYRMIINHSGMKYESEVPVIDTRLGDSATSSSALDRLGEVILGNMRVKRRSGERINIDNFRSVARFHYLNDSWLDDVQIRGRYPRWKVLKDNVQIAMWAPERGGFSLAKASVPLLDSLNSLKRIQLKPEIKWKGDINLAILESYDDSIRSGEDILVMQGSQCIGSARAAAPAWEWEGTPGRLAKMHQRL
jgi:predicted RNA-binding protein